MDGAAAAAARVVSPPMGPWEDDDRTFGDLMDRCVEKFLVMNPKRDKMTLLIDSIECQHQP
jgi:hypothetical protein